MLPGFDPYNVCSPFSHQRIQARGLKPTPNIPTAPTTLWFSFAVKVSYVFLNALAGVEEGPVCCLLETEVAFELEVAGTAVGARRGGIVSFDAVYKTLYSICSVMRTIRVVTFLALAT